MQLARTTATVHRRRQAKTVNWKRKHVKVIRVMAPRSVRCLNALFMDISALTRSWKWLLCYPWVNEEVYLILKNKSRILSGLHRTT